MGSCASSSVNHSDLMVIKTRFKELEKGNAEMTHIYRYQQNNERTQRLPGGGFFYHEGAIVQYNKVDDDEGVALSTRNRKKVLQTRYLKIDWGDKELSVNDSNNFPSITRLIPHSKTEEFQHADLPNLSPFVFVVLLNVLADSGYGYHLFERNCRHFTDGIWKICVEWRCEPPDPEQLSLVKAVWPGACEGLIMDRLERGGSKMRVWADKKTQKQAPPNQLELICTDYPLDGWDPHGRPMFQNEHGLRIMHSGACWVVQGGDTTFATSLATTNSPMFSGSGRIDFRDTQNNLYFAEPKLRGQ